MWPVLFYVNSLYFQQWNSNWGIALFNSSLDPTLRVLIAGLRLYFKTFFLIHKKIENWYLLILLQLIFQFMKEIEYWDFWILALPVLPNFSQFTNKLENWNATYFHFLSDWENTASLVGNGSCLGQFFKCWECCFVAKMRENIAKFP